MRWRATRDLGSKLQVQPHHRRRFCGTAKRPERSAPTLREARRKRGEQQTVGIAIERDGPGGNRRDAPVRAARRRTDRDVRRRQRVKFTSVSRGQHSNMLSTASSESARQPSSESRVSAGSQRAHATAVSALTPAKSTEASRGNCRTRRSRSCLSLACAKGSTARERTAEQLAVRHARATPLLLATRSRVARNPAPSSFDVVRSASL